MMQQGVEEMGYLFILTIHYIIIVKHNFFDAPVQCRMEWSGHLHLLGNFLEACWISNLISTNLTSVHFSDPSLCNLIHTLSDVPFKSYHLLTVFDCAIVEGKLWCNQSK